MQQLAARKVTVLAIDSLPRTLSRVQKMDALTSQAGVAGYRAVPAFQALLKLEREMQRDGGSDAAR